MAHDIMVTNRENILHWIDRFQDELSRLRATIAAGESEGVIGAFTRAQMERDNYLVNGAPSREQRGEPIETVSLGDMLLGSKITSYMKKQQELAKQMEDRQKGRRP
jgi:hypothetical protein